MLLLVHFLCLPKICLLQLHVSPVVCFGLLLHGRGRLSSCGSLGRALTLPCQLERFHHEKKSLTNKMHVNAMNQGGQNNFRRHVACCQHCHGKPACLFLGRCILEGNTVILDAVILPQSLDKQLGLRFMSEPSLSQEGIQEKTGFSKPSKSDFFFF